MTSLLIAAKIVPMIFVALFPVVNPIGTALVLYGMTGKVDDKTWKTTSRKIAFNTFLLLTFFFFFGGYILKLFGISIPVVQLAGGMVVASIGWGLLNQKKRKNSRRRTTSRTPPHRLKPRRFTPTRFRSRSVPAGWRSCLPSAPIWTANRNFS